MTCPLKVMKRFLLLILLIIPLAFTSCEQEDWPVKTDQTVLMYLPWSSNLKSYFETNISDFESVVETKHTQERKGCSILLYFAH